MSLTILLLLLFTVLLLLYGWRSKYFLLFAFLVFSTAFSMLTLMMDIARNSNYVVQDVFLIGPLETRLYALCRLLLRFPLSTLLILRNTGIVAYFGGIVCFVLTFSGSARFDQENSRRQPWQYILIGLFLLLFFLLGIQSLAEQVRILDYHYQSGAEHRHKKDPHQKPSLPIPQLSRRLEKQQADNDNTKQKLAEGLPEEPWFLKITYHQILFLRLFMHFESHLLIHSEGGIRFLDRQGNLRVTVPPQQMKHLPQEFRSDALMAIILDKGDGQ